MSVASDSMRQSQYFPLLLVLKDRLEIEKNRRPSKRFYIICIWISWCCFISDSLPALSTVSSPSFSGSGSIWHFHSLPEFGTNPDSQNSVLVYEFFSCQTVWVWNSFTTVKISSGPNFKYHIINHSITRKNMFVWVGGTVFLFC